MSNKKLAIEVQVDKSFHHASLVFNDTEWGSIQSISKFAPYIYIGNFQNAIDPVELKDKDIKLILAITPFDKDADTKKIYTEFKIIHQFLPLDNIPYPTKEGEKTLKDIYDDAYNLITKCVTNKMNILVHCMQGVSSAPAVVAYYSLRFAYIFAQSKNQLITNNMLPSIVKLLKEGRQCVCINYGFLEQLEDIEAKISHRPVNFEISLSTQRNKKLMEYYKMTLQNNVAKDLAAMKKGTYKDDDD